MKKKASPFPWEEFWAAASPYVEQGGRREQPEDAEGGAVPGRECWRDGFEPLIPCLARSKHMP